MNAADEIKHLRTRVVELEERIAELYWAQKSRFLSAKSEEYDIDHLRSTLSDAQATLAAVRADLAPIHMCDVVSRDCAICTVVLRIDAFLSGEGA